jgi:curved DNA-binding protein CbpA
VQDRELSYADVTVMPRSAPAPRAERTAATPSYSEVQAKLRSIRAGADHYEVLEVTREVSPEQIKAAYRELAKKYHPDRHSQVIALDNAFKRQLEIIFAAVLQAHITLSDGDERTRYDRALERRGLDQAPVPTEAVWRADPGRAATTTSSAASTFTPLNWYTVGMEYARAGDRDRAREAFKRATALAPLDARLHETIGRSLAQVKGFHKEAEKALLTAVDLLPEPASALVELSRLYRHYGRERDAQRVLERAHACDARNGPARAATGPSIRGVGPLLGRLFGPRRDSNEQIKANVKKSLS